MMISLNKNHLRALALLYFIKWCEPAENDNTLSLTQQAVAILSWAAPIAKKLRWPKITQNQAFYLESLNLIRTDTAEMHIADYVFDSSFVDSRLKPLLTFNQNFGDLQDTLDWLQSAAASSQTPRDTKRVAMTFFGVMIGYTAFCVLVGETPNYDNYADILE